MFDAIYRKIPTIIYAPDLYEYQNGSNGLLFDLNDYCKPILTMNLKDLFHQMILISKFDFFSQKGMLELYSKIREEHWSNIDSSYEKIWSDIKKLN